MPQNITNEKLIQELFGDLQSREGNHKEYIALCLEKHSIINKSMPTGLRLIRTVEQYGFFKIALLSDIDESVLYVVHCDIMEQHCMDGKTPTQVLVWRVVDPRYKKETSGLAEYIFNSVLLDEYTIVASDSSQTLEGRRFWQQMLAEAIYAGHDVYRFDTSTCIRTDIADITEVTSNSIDLWGDHPRYSKILAMIAKT